ncbi:MAG TPA: flavodoxin family protein [Thermodesulfobacteriota bacterium]|nr:flavodoxin family protein [Thermodesulfobacteriota bacterium]
MIIKALAIYGSPRKGGNTDLLLNETVKGMKEAGAQVDEIFLREMKFSPCLELYACENDGRCAIKDDMEKVYPKLIEMDCLALASPIFFYAVSAHTKAFIDRCQCFWTGKYLLKKPIAGGKKRKGVFIAVGGSKGQKIFDGPLLTIKYLFDVLDCELFKTLLYREVDRKGDILDHPTALSDAYLLGKELIASLALTSK